MPVVSRSFLFFLSSILNSTSLLLLQMVHDDESFISVRALCASLFLVFPKLTPPPFLVFPQQLRKAITPHDRYIPPWMKHSAMEVRVDAWLQTNWTRKAEEAIKNEPERLVGYVSSIAYPSL